MSDKYKPWQDRKPSKARNQDVVDFATGRYKGGPMTDKREKRGRKDRDWKNEIRDYTRP